MTVLTEPKPIVDPYHLVPQSIPPHPRVWTTPKKLTRSHALLKSAPWGPAVVDHLTTNARQRFDLNRLRQHEADTEANQDALRRLSHGAIVAAITGDLQMALEAQTLLEAIASAFVTWPLHNGNCKAAGGNIPENTFVAELAGAYDLLAGLGTVELNHELIRAALREAYEVIDAEPHRDCGNHNTTCLVARLQVAAALGDTNGIHEALYGNCPASGRRYGLVHHFEHDFLPDGVWFERTVGYHQMMLYYIAHAADTLENLGVDLWHAEFDAQLTADSLDRHEDYGPAGKRTVRAPFEAPFYWAYKNLDTPTTHDSPFTDLISTPDGWGPVCELAYEAYQDPKYAWLLSKIYAEQGNELPRFLPKHIPISNVLKVRRHEFPPGSFDWSQDTSISVTGRHENGCTHFPDAGIIFLRHHQGGDAYVQYGPHAVGHQSPAALHLDIHDANTPFTRSPAFWGYEDARQLTWYRTTIAHNTVTVDGQPMIPYHAGGESIWEAERFHGTSTQGKCLGISTGPDVLALRVSNELVYPGTTLDRTVLLTADWLLDVFRVNANEVHCYDWAMHLDGQRPDMPGTAIDLGEGLGYRHLQNTEAMTTTDAIWPVNWQRHSGPATGQVVVPSGGQILIASTPVQDGDRWPIGRTQQERGRFAIIVRQTAKQALFVSLWNLNTRPASISDVAGAPDGDIEVAIAAIEGPQRVRLPHTGLPTIA